MTDASHERMWILHALLSAFFLLATVAEGLALTGSLAVRSAQAQFKVQHCGGFRDRVPVTVQLRDDGTWLAVTDEPAFSGTYTVADASGRKLALAFDPDSEAGFHANVASDASGLCRTAVSVTSLTAKVFEIKFNRKGTRAKFNIRFVGTGTAGRRSGRVTNRLTGEGRWTAG